LQELIQNANDQKKASKLKEAVREHLL
jgi:hypothetical protein